MATYTISEAIARINGLLDLVAADAEITMKNIIESKADKGYATGALAASINTRVISDHERGVGTSLKNPRSGYVYGEAVDKGRGPINKNPGHMHYYDPKLGRWVKTHHVAGMSGINFISETAAHLKNIGL